MSYPQLLNQMMNAILSGDAAPACALVRDKKDFPREAQLNVYVEGYRMRLREVLEAAYPALLYYLGVGRFRALADAFIEATPSRYFNLDRYPLAFAGYVASVADDAFARDLAALEQAIHGVYGAEESQAITPEWAAKQTPDLLALTHFRLRAASVLLACEYKVEDYVADFREGKEPAKPAAQTQYLLVLRHLHQVRRHRLDAGEYALLALLAQGRTLAEALEYPQFAVDEALPAKLTGWFARWIGQGFLRQPS